MTIMAKNAKEYGLDDVIPDPPLEYDVAVMASPTHVALIADLTETPVAEIQALNPALLKNVAPAGYQVNVPHGTANTLIASLQTVPPERRASWRMHKSGERRDLGDHRQEIWSRSGRDRRRESHGVGDAGGRRSPDDPANRGPGRGEEPGGPPVERQHGAQKYGAQGRRGKEDRLTIVDDGKAKGEERHSSQLQPQKNQFRGPHLAPYYRFCNFSFLGLLPTLKKGLF